MATVVAGVHPTGMHSCYQSFRVWHVNSPLFSFSSQSDAKQECIPVGCIPSATACRLLWGGYLQAGTLGNPAPARHAGIVHPHCEQND